MTATDRLRAITARTRQLPKLDANLALVPVDSAPDRREARLELRIAGTRPSTVRIIASSKGFTLALSIDEEAAA